MTKLTNFVRGLFSMLAVFVAGSVVSQAQTTTVNWDAAAVGSAAASVNLEGKTGTVAGDVEGYELSIDATSGKINSAARDNDFQINATVIVKIPVFTEGDVINLTNYGGSFSITYSIGAETGINSDSKSYTVSKAEAKAGFVTMTITEGGYFRKFQAVYQPRVETVAPGTSFTNQAVSAVWDFNDAANYATVSSVTPAGSLSQTSFDLGTATVTGVASSSNISGVTFVKVQAANSKDDLVSWNVKPAKGLTFTPTKVSGKINRGATDVQSGVTISVKSEGSSAVNLATYTAPRSNKSKGDDKWGASADYSATFDITLTDEQQAALSTTGVFSLKSTIGVAAGKEGLFSDIHIEGLLNGTVQDVEKFTLSASANISEAGTVSAYPASAEYEAGEKVSLKAEEKFGYDFVNWTDADGQVVSENASFSYTVEKNASFTANFKAVDTYAVNVTVEGGNDYMVSLSPAATIVDGKNMYEAGQKVTLTALPNDVVKFSNWSTGATSASIDVIVDKNIDVIATFAASDFIAIWDFYRAGKQDRIADFASEGNESAALVMYNETTKASVGWLDKSQVNGGFEGQPAAVCWVAGSAIGDVGHHYWQIKVNASSFTDIKLQTAMSYNYNAYPTYNIDYSFDGENWSNLGSIAISGAKQWPVKSFSFPAEANNKANLYIRWSPDKSVSVKGSDSNNDGIALGAIYVTGTAGIVNDGVAPALTASVPAQNANTASANGKIVLTFDEKVKIADGVKATLSDGVNSIELTPVASGKSVICEYKGLAYSTSYTFTFPANAVADLADNALSEQISIAFATRVRPAVDKKLYDFVVPTDGSLAEAITAANTRADKTARYRIFVMDGNYVLPASESATVTVSVTLANGTTESRTYADPRTTLSASNVSIIGSDLANVVITNACPTETYVGKYGEANIAEGIGQGDVLINRGANNYFQGITIKTSIGDNRGRDIAYNDQGDKTIFKDASLWGYQDTYVSNNQSGRYYFEGGVLRGRTDYLCGKGDVFYNAVTLQQCGQGGYLAVPSNARQYGYVFKDCYIKKETADVTYYLGRPWGQGTPSALFVDTKVDAAPIASGWSEMNGGWPARMAEYNTHLANGSVVDLSTRKTTFSDTHTNNPILTASEAAELTVDNVLAGSDDWDPQALAEQVSAPTGVTLVGNELSWDENPYALLFAICKDGKVVDFTTSYSYTVDDVDAIYSVRAANEMGGLGEAGVMNLVTGNQDVDASREAVSVEVFNAAGQRLAAPARGINYVRVLFSDGSVETKSVIVK